MSEGGKQQRYQDFCISGHQRGGLQEGGSTLIRQENRHHPEIRAGRDPESTRVLKTSC